MTIDGGRTWISTAKVFILVGLIALPGVAWASGKSRTKQEGNKTRTALADLRVDFSTWADNHPNAVPIWVLPKSVAPKNMEWTVPSMPGQIPPGSYIHPTVCGGCHTEIFRQWIGAMHANAWRDPIFLAVYKHYLKESKTRKEQSETALCTRCHAPAAYLTDDRGRYFVGDISAEGHPGVSCDFCHTVRASAGIGNGAYISAPGPIKWGPRKDSVSPYHQSAYSELHTRSAFCGQCHDEAHAEGGLPIGSTYSEWRASKYFTGDPATSVHCQDCHMRQTPRVASTGVTERPNSPGRSALVGKRRPHIWQHVFVGGNAAVAEMLGFREHARMARVRLRHAAQLVIRPEGHMIPGMQGSIAVEVTNVGAGHYLPTGLTYIRQMWLEVVVSDSEGLTLLHSGAVDETGAIGPKAVIYRTVLGGPEFKPTAFLPGAVTIVSDYRIPPKGSRLERYFFAVPDQARGSLTVKAVLHYRSAPQKLIDDLLGKDAPRLPIITMTEADAHIPVWSGIDSK